MFKIQVKTIQGTILTFTVQKYSITDGDFVTFIDERNGDTKLFHSSNCEIKEVKE